MRFGEVVLEGNADVLSRMKCVVIVKIRDSILWLCAWTGLDVERTDRMLQFYDDIQNRSRLWDILAVYAWYDPEIGYCQGNWLAEPSHAPISINMHLGKWKQNAV